MPDLYEDLEPEPFRSARANVALFRTGFIDWLTENPHVYAEFERRALQVAARREHYGARTIMEVIRHDTVIGNLTGEWKINNNLTPDCARLFEIMHPSYAGFFEFRNRPAKPMA